MTILLRNRYFALTDLLVWVLLPAGLLAMRLEGVAGLDAYLPGLIVFALIAVPVKFALFYVFGLYRRYWRYASVDELIDLTMAALFAALIVVPLYGVLWQELFADLSRLPRSVTINEAVIGLVLTGGIRLWPRVYMRLRRRWARAQVGERVLIIGAGDAGSMIVRELRQNPQLRMEPVGFIDDDRRKKGTEIHGLEVFGGREEIRRLARELRVRTAIIAMPTATGRVIREIRDLCEDAKMLVKTIPGVYDIIAGRVRVSQIRDVQIDDLLRREPVQTDREAAARLLSDTTVLITGAGGSIGAELCRQIAYTGVRKLVLMGHGENSIFDIHAELASLHRQLDVVPVIADIRDRERIDAVFDAHLPQVVFHAAAHKHVPLMELQPEEAVTNNVGGTRNVLAAAERVGVGHFVLISTDKAVRPANVMGAAKLLAEQLVHEAAIRTGKVFVSVRFGNVLGSRGSVVPFFRQQIAAGGPVTVTHPEMTRYFMTIPEAVQLVLQAAAMGKGGETFVLDMGQPVKIVDLAKDLIHLSGLEVGTDIEIVYTGLRPGEKLYEELFEESEQFGLTEHPKIMVSSTSRAKLRHDLVDRLVAAGQHGSTKEVRRLLGELVPGMTFSVTPGTARAPSKPERASDPHRVERAR
jgi:FlaA1/EpsC-like NDP-sugar epimerase